MERIFTLPMHAPLRLLRKPVILFPVIALIAGSIWLLVSRRAGEPSETLPVERQTVVQEVIVTGTVRAAQTVDLAFEVGGKIATVTGSIGDQVPAGAALASLAAEDRAAEFRQAEAQARAEAAKLDELRRGTRQEELLVKNAKVGEAAAKLEEAVIDAFTKSDDAVRNRVDQFISNPTANPQLNFAIADPELEFAVERQRLALGSMFNLWSFSLGASAGTIESRTGTARENTAAVRKFLDATAQAVALASPSTVLSQATIDDYRAGVATARTNVSAAASALAAAASAHALANREFELSSAGAAPEEIRGQEAALAKAQAAVEAASAAIAKTVIRAPFAGVITRQDAEVGEVVAANTPVVSLIAENAFEIEANVPEADTAKLITGMPAKVSLDAYGSTAAFEAVVDAIEPAATVIEGVPTYKTTFRFTGAPEGLRPGMTADITITVARREGVLAVPQRMIIRRGKEAFVLVEREGASLEERKIETGLSGSDGTAEITAGLNEGERIANPRTVE